MMHLISEIPEPAAYGAKDFTRVAEVNAKAVLQSVRSGPLQDQVQECLSYREDHVEYVIQWLEASPPMPVGAAYQCFSACSHRVWRILPTVVLPPAAEVLVEIKSRLAVPQLDVRQPLRHYIEESSVETDGGADERHDDPALGGVVRLPKPMPPAQLSVVIEAGISSPSGLAPQLFSGCILHPVYIGV